MTNIWHGIYNDERFEFSDAAQLCRAKVTEYPITPSASVAVATLGSETSPNLLVMTSGVHGAELPTGSLIQTAFMLAAAETTLKTRVVIVHDLNPVGTSLGLRTNSYGVDLNRNFLQDFDNLPANPVYEKLASAFAPKSLSRTRNALAWARMYGFVASQRSQKPFVDAMTRGQYSHPGGLYYGGKEPAKENLTWHRIANDHFQGAQNIIHLDFHSGLGERGKPALMPANNLSSDTKRTIESIWLEEKISRDGDLTIANKLTGDILDSWQQPNMPQAANVIPVAVEFGTVSPIKVMKAMRDRMTLYWREADAHPRSERILQNMEDAFSPQDPEWRKRVTTRGLTIVDSAVKYLNAQNG